MKTGLLKNIALSASLLFLSTTGMLAGCNRDTDDSAVEGVCGDAVVDAGEECDEGTDGNDGELCNADCTLPDATAESTYRCDSLEVLEPSFYLPTSSNCHNVDAIVNKKVQDFVSVPDESTGTYELNIVQSMAFPLPEAGVEFSSKMSFPEVCTAGAGGASDSCEVDGAASVTWTMVQPTEDGPCFERMPSTANADGWLDNVENELAGAAIPTQGVNSCLRGAVEENFSLAFLGEQAELNGAYMAVEIDESGDKPSVVQGMIGGFITVEEAKGLSYETNSSSIGTVKLAELLNGSEDGCMDTVEMDKGPAPDGSVTDGWWVYLSFGADGIEVVSAE